jgi:hypothetical protein
MDIEQTEPPARSPGQAQQLALLPPADQVPVQLRLSERTRRVGLVGVARARAILAEQAARRRTIDERTEHLPERAA